MEDIKVTSSIDLKTYYYICLRIYLKRRALILLIPFVAVQITFFLEPPVSWNDELLLIGVFGALYIVSIWGMYRACKIQTQRTPYLKEEVHYKLNPDKIELSGESFTHVCTWQYVSTLMEREKYFLMFNQNRTFYYLPKDGFESREATAGFKEMVKEKGIKFSYN